MSRTVASAAPIGSEAESRNGWVRPIRAARAAMRARPAWAAVAVRPKPASWPIAIESWTGTVLTDRASAIQSGSGPAWERP
jgi:hypothetical protein